MHTHSITPNHDALTQMAQCIWEIACTSNTRPLVILPTAGPNSSLRLALEKNRPDPHRLLPEVRSLSDWLDLAPDIFTLPDAQSTTERILQTYASIDSNPELRQWFEAEGEGGAWSLAKAIVSACELLSQSIVPQLTWDPTTINLEAGLDQVQAQFNEAIQAAYPALAQTLVSKEAAVLFAFWRYLSSVRDPVVRQHLALASYAKQFAQTPAARRPLIWIETVTEQVAQARTHEQFLQICAKHIPVHRITMDWSELGLWSETLDDQQQGSHINTQIERNQQQLSDKSIRCISAKRFEDLAWEATRCIESHLLLGRTQIALIAQDRLLARRTRALLARLGTGLAIEDETGWKISTTRAAAALHAWLELIRSPKAGPTASTLLEFLKNPFIDLAHVLQTTESATQSLVGELENILQLKQARASWVSFYLAIEAGANPEFDARLPLLLQKVREQVERWQRAELQNPLCANALTQLLDDLQFFGMQQQFEQDAAGVQLLAMLQNLGMQQNKLGALRMPLNEWIILLKTVMEEEVYRERGGEAKARVTIMPLSATRLRHFDAVVMVGCDERQLPSYTEQPLFFSETLCQTLGGTDRAWQYRQQARDLSQLLASYSHIDLLWQSEGASGEPLRASAWILRLQSALTTLKTREASNTARSGQTKITTMASAKRLPQLPMPTRMSPSAYRALRSCPYQYYVRSLLGLRKRKGLDEELDASIIGQTLHQILRNFFQELKTTQARDAKRMSEPEYRKQWMIDHLNQASMQGFAKLVEGDRRVLGSLRDWQKQIPSFIEWQLEREHNAWQFHDAECKVGFEFPFTDTHQHEHSIRIEGYADRIDINPSNQTLAILDYKHQSRKRVEERSEQLMDDPQLLLYAKAISEQYSKQQGSVTELDWVALKIDLKKKAPIDRTIAIESVSEATNQLEQQLQEDLSAVWSGTPMRAFAPDSTCRYCDARGICRKGMW